MKRILDDLVLVDRLPVILFLELVESFLAAFITLTRLFTTPTSSVATASSRILLLFRLLRLRLLTRLFHINSNQTRT